MGTTPEKQPKKTRLREVAAVVLSLASATPSIAEEDSNRQDGNFSEARLESNDNLFIPAYRQEALNFLTQMRQTDVKKEAQKDLRNLSPQVQLAIAQMPRGVIENTPSDELLQSVKVTTRLGMTRKEQEEVANFQRKALLEMHRILSAN